MCKLLTDVITVRSGGYNFLIFQIDDNSIYIEYDGLSKIKITKSDYVKQGDINPNFPKNTYLAEIKIFEQIDEDTIEDNWDYGNPIFLYGLCYYLTHKEEERLKNIFDEFKDYNKFVIEDSGSVIITGNKKHRIFRGITDGVRYLKNIYGIE